MLFNNNIYIYIYVLKSWNSFLDWPSRRKQDTYVRAFVLLFLFVESTHGTRHGKATNTLTRKERRVYFLIYENTFFLIIYEASIYHMIVTNARTVDVYIYKSLLSLFPDLRTTGPPKWSVFAWKTERRNKTANIRGCATPTNDNKFDCPANGNAREF